eukprot:scaffold1352_cov261-Pinguiococcus_pyrenoidosus.AAC.16
MLGVLPKQVGDRSPVQKRRRGPPPRRTSSRDGGGGCNDKLCAATAARLPPPRRASHSPKTNGETHFAVRQFCCGVAISSSDADALCAVVKPLSTRAGVGSVRPGDDS